jgi:hypothetical protein
LRQAGLREGAGLPRSLTIFFPDGRTTEYWYTALVFKVGDSLERNGESWIVTSIALPDGGDDGDGNHTTITVRPNSLSQPA